MGILTQDDRDYVNREVLRLAIGRELFCSECKTVLDIREAVLITTPKNLGGEIAIACAACFDSKTQEVLGKSPGAGEWEALGIDVIDGRELS